MSATILDGWALAREMRAEITEEVKSFIESRGFVPTLAVVRAGEDPASVWYSRAISRTLEKRGLQADIRVLPADIAQDDLELKEVSRDKVVGDFKGGPAEIIEVIIDREQGEM